MSDEEYLNVDAEGLDGTGEAVAAILEIYATALQNAPDDKRYDFELQVNERTVETGDEQ